MQTEEQFFTIEATYRLVNILNGNYMKSDLEQAAANSTQMNYKERTQLLRLLKGFEEFFMAL